MTTETKRTYTKPSEEELRRRLTPEQQYLATAELLDPECYLLDRARARVHGPEPGDGPGIDV